MKGNTRTKTDRPAPIRLATPADAPAEEKRTWAIARGLRLEHQDCPVCLGEQEMLLPYGDRRFGRTIISHCYPCGGTGDQRSADLYLLSQGLLHNCARCEGYGAIFYTGSGGGSVGIHRCTTCRGRGLRTLAQYTAEALALRLSGRGGNEEMNEHTTYWVD